MTNFDFSFGAPGQQLQARRVADKLRILVLADYRGHNNRRPPLEARQPRRVSIDNFDALLKRWAPLIKTGEATDETAISCAKLTDFDPDTLYVRLPLFAALQQSRVDIGRGKIPAMSDQKTVAAQQKNEPATPETGEDTFSRLLGESAGTPQKKTGGGLLDTFISKLVADEISPADNTKKDHLGACDAAISEVMRAVLHDPAFQRMEATWRGLYELINSIEAEDTLSVFAMDVSEAEIRDDLLGGDRQHSTLVTCLVEEGTGSFGGEPWDIIVANLAPVGDQVELIAALGAVAQAAGGHLFADADIHALGDEVPESWTALRSSAAAASICLTTPRVLLRAPYGKQNDMPESFAFEECPVDPEHSELLWGSSALLVVNCMAQQFENEDHRGNLSNQEAAANRPLFVFEKDGTRTMQAVAETLLSDSQAENLRDRWGVMPLRPERNGNRLLFVNVQYLAQG